MEPDFMEYYHRPTQDYISHIEESNKQAAAQRQAGDLIKEVEKIDHEKNNPSTTITQNPASCHSVV